MHSNDFTWPTFPVPHNVILTTRVSSDVAEVENFTWIESTSDQKEFTEFY